MLQDIEFTLVHELVRLEMTRVLSDRQRSDANRMDEEGISKSIIASRKHRRGRPLIAERVFGP